MGMNAMRINLSETEQYKPFAYIRI